MEKLTEQTLVALLTQAGLEPKKGDLEQFGHLLDTYMAALKTLHSVNLEDEEVAPTFHPEWTVK